MLLAKDTSIYLFIFRFLDLLEVHLLDGILVLFTLEISIPITVGLLTLNYFSIVNFF